MRRLACLVVLAAPALAFAQPSPDPAPPYNPGTGTAPPPAAPPQVPYGPSTGSGPYAPPPPQQPGPYGQPPQQPGPYGQPQPYGQPYGQPYQPQPAPLRSGMTFEANLGIGWIRASGGGQSETSDLGVGGLCLGVGGWINGKTAITGRFAGVTYSQDSSRFTNGFLGVAAQYWIDDHIWVGGGAGLGVVAVAIDGYGSDSKGGVGLEGRVGYTFTTGSESTFNASFELNPGFFTDDNDNSFTYTGIALLLGYQHL